MDVSWTFFAILLAGGIAGGFINGLAGFGTALFALGFWLQIMEPLRAVAIVMVMSVASGLQGLWVVRASIRERPRRLAIFLLPALVGVPLGVQLLAVIDATTLKLVIAAFLILYGGYFAFRKTLPTLTRDTPLIDGIVGFAGGVLGGAASLSGALPTMWLSMRPWPKAQSRAVLQPFNVAVLLAGLLLLAWRGAYDRETLIWIAIVLAPAMIAAQIGIMIFKSLSDDAFRRLLIVMMLVSGLVLLAREVLA